jgi:hypothetical protein
MCAAEGSLASKRATRSSNWTSRARSSVESRSGGGSGGMCARRRGKRRAHIVAGVAPPGYATLILPVAKGPERRRPGPGYTLTFGAGITDLIEKPVLSPDE